MHQPNWSGVSPVRRFREPPVAGRPYVERPGAYAVVRSRGNVLMVEWQGQLYLPGGGIDPGEGTLAALHRECLEETGWRIRVERRLGASQRYLYAADLDVWLRKVCHVYLARPHCGSAARPSLGVARSGCLWEPQRPASAAQASEPS